MVTVEALKITFVAAALVTVAEGFRPNTLQLQRTNRGGIGSTPHRRLWPVSVASSIPPPRSPARISQRRRRTTELGMSDGEGEGPSLAVGAFTSVVLLGFVASAVLPLVEFSSSSPRDFNLADSVVPTRQDGPPSKGGLANYQSSFDALSTAKIQRKLSNLPVFYLTDGDGKMGDRIYLSYDEAELAASSRGSPSSSVKATTLDQVMYPLILGRYSSIPASPAPAEVKNAIREAMDGARNGDDGAVPPEPRPPSSSAYSLVPSRAALRDAQQSAEGASSLRSGDVPLFVVERLAFAGDDGRPRVPLFTERGDAVVSYGRLREGGSGSLPEAPTIRTTSLLDVIDSMERGTRPAVGQLELYGNADDVLKADEMSK